MFLCHFSNHKHIPGDRLLDELGTCVICGVISVEDRPVGSGPEYQGTLEYQTEEFHLTLGTMGSH